MIVFKILSEERQRKEVHILIPLDRSIDKEYLGVAHPESPLNPTVTHELPRAPDVHSEKAIKLLLQNAKNVDVPFPGSDLGRTSVIVLRERDLQHLPPEARRHLTKHRRL